MGDRPFFFGAALQHGPVRVAAFQLAHLCIGDHIAKGVVLGLMAVYLVVFGITETNTHIRNTADIVDDAFDPFDIIFDLHRPHRLDFIVMLVVDIVKFFPFREDSATFKENSYYIFIVSSDMI